MKMVSENVHKEEKIKLPKAVPFIVAYAFFQGFAGSAYRTVLILYLRNQLIYSDDTSTVIFHAVTTLSAFLSIFGAIVADSWLGKFRSISNMSIVAVVGFAMLAISAVTPLHLPDRPFAFVGFVLLIIGAAGITPCINPFGGDQFVLPLQQRHLSKFFSLMYFSANSAACISMLVTPILRQDVACFGDNTCYSLAFFISVISMLLAVVIFTLGKSTYKINTPKGNVILDVTKCISHAIGNRFRRNRGVAREHWLDYADDKYDRTLITEIRSAFAVLKMFLPLHIFWALMSQQGSRWTIQATRMDGQIGSWLLKPDQMQMLNPLLVIILIPLFTSCLYPALEKSSLVITPLRKITVGGILAGFAFIVSAILELQLEKTYPVIPSNGLAQVRIFNTLNCPIDMSVGGQTFVLDKLSVWENKSIEADGKVSLDYTANYAECIRLGMMPGMKKDARGTITAIEASAISWVVTPTTDTMYSYVDNVNRTRTGDPSIRVLMYANDSIGSSFPLNFVKDSKTVFSLNVSSGFTKTELKTLNFGTYSIYLNNMPIASTVELKNGGIYTVTAYVNDISKAAANIITITNPNSLHMLWLLPQYLVITVSEVLLAVTASEFAFTQAPVSMKSLIMAFLVLSISLGDLIVVIVADISLFTSQASEYFLFAGLMWGDMLIFGIMAMYYKYVDQSNDKLTKEPIHMEQQGGSVNRTYTADDGS